MLKRKIKLFDSLFTKRSRKSLKAFIETIIQRLNFFDVLVLLSLLFIFLILMRNFFQKKSEWINVRLLVQQSDWWYKGEKPPFWYARSLKVGDFAYDSFGEQVAEVLSIENYDSGEDGQTIYVNLKVKTDLDKKKQQYIYEFKPLLKGSGIIFNFEQEQLRGLIIELNQEFDLAKSEKHQIKVRINLILPELAAQVEVGKKITDSFGKELAKVVAVDREIANYYEYSDIRGQKILISDPAYRLLLITLDIDAASFDKQLYFIDGTPIKIGQLFDLNFSNFVLKDVEIISID